MSNFDTSFDDDDDLFGDESGDLAIPTVRGNANLDIQDYQGWDGDSSLLDDDLQEDIPSRPGAGAAAATDVDGTDSFDLLGDDTDLSMDDPGMKQTDYGASPWGPGSSTGYRPFSQQTTDMNLRALGDDEPKGRPMMSDDMSMEPEVINAVPVGEPTPWRKEWHGNRNQQPSNADVDPMTLYDRSSYEYDDSSQDTIGSGIFGMEEGVTWRARDGIFANQNALPAYIAEEDELGVQQSQMWDATAGNWRVTQPSASGVPLSRRVSHLRPAPRALRPEVTGPRSHVEAFGRKAAKVIVNEAMAHPPSARESVLRNAVNSLGPDMANKCHRAAAALTAAGMPKEVALEDVLAHAVMSAAAKDLTRPRRGSVLPHLDRMAAAVKTKRNSNSLRSAAMQHIAPLNQDSEKLRSDLGALYGSPAGHGMGQVTQEDALATPAPAAAFTPTNLLLLGAVGGAAYLLWDNRDSLMRNAKKLRKRLGG